MHPQFARILILLGGILGFVISVISFSMIPFMATVLGYWYGTIWEYGGTMMTQYGLFGYPQFGTEMMPIVMTLWSLLGLAGGILSIFSSLRLQRANNRFFVGVVGGVFLLLSFLWLPSLIVLAGCVLFCLK